MPTVPVLPAPLAALVWRGAGTSGWGPGDQATKAVVASGYGPLDAQLPGGGWPLAALSELLLDEPASCEWRLLAPVLKQAAAHRTAVFLIAPPQPPHGLIHALGAHVVWVHAHTTMQALWACQQVIQSGTAGAVVVWLTGVKAPALRRLQACAQTSAIPVFVIRPAHAQHESSPAPLRINVAPEEPGSLKLRILKRRGPLHEGEIELPALPDGLGVVLAGKRMGRHQAAKHTGGTLLPPTPLQAEVAHAALAGVAPPLAPAH